MPLINLKKYRIEFENGVIQEKYLIPKELPYFTHGSPMHGAIKSGKLDLPPQQGGLHKVKITEIKDTNE